MKGSTAVAVTGLVASLFYILYLRRARKVNGAVILPSIPLFGNFLEFATNPNFLKENKAKYGEILRFSWFNQHMYAFPSVEGARWVFKNDGKGIAVSWPSHWIELIGKRSMINFNGEEHKRRRALMSPMFTPRSLNQYFDSIVYLSKVDLGEIIKSSNGKPFSFYDSVKRYTFNVATKVFLGYDERNPRGKELLENFYVWLSGLESIPINLPFSGLGKALKARKRILEILQAEIDERRKNGLYLPNHSGPVDFLNQMLESNEFSDEEIKDEVTLLLFAGHDTSAASGSTVTYILGSRPDIKEKIVKEFNENFQDTESMDYDKLISLPYLDSVIKETLRRFPPINGGIRVATEDLQFKDFSVKKGSGLAYNVPYFHNNDEFYEDSDEFKPERFLNNSVDEVTFIPFGSGPRVCLGQNLAKLELKIYATVLAVDYDIEIVSSKFVNFPVKSMKCVAKLTQKAK